MILFLQIFFLCLGLIFGSFISALSWRYPKGISIAKGRSICPNCKKQIAWFDNIPLFSYLVLGGKCRNCKKNISLRYPLIEFVTAVGFVAIFSFVQGQSLHAAIALLFYLLIYCLLILIFVIDLENQLIPDSFVFFGIIVILIYYVITDSPLIFPSLFAGFLSAAILFLIHLATRGRGMGLGDVKFAIFGGLITGLNLFLIWLFLAFLTGGLTGIILILGKRAGFKDHIAFGPFLVISIPITLIWGQKILEMIFLH